MIINLTINIEKEGLNKFKFIKKIDDILKKWIEGNISVRIITTDEFESKKYMSFNFRIKEYENEYFYNFYYFLNNALIYDYSSFINKKDITKLYNYLARDIDEVIKMYKNVNE